MTDATGKYSQDDQLQAYVAFQAMASGGGLLGGGSAAQNLVKQVNRSSIGQLQIQLQAKYVTAMIAGQESGGATGAAKASLASFDSMSSFDQKVLFQVTSTRSSPMGRSPISISRSSGPSFRAVLNSDPIRMLGTVMPPPTLLQTWIRIAEVSKLFGS